MKIEILSISNKNLVQVPGTRFFGNDIRFKCDLTEGSAILVKSYSLIRELEIGDEIYVESSQESISNLKMIGTKGHPKMEPCTRARDYLIQGIIIDSNEEGLLTAQVSDLYFDICVQKGEIKRFTEGKWISFILHGLVLWAINL